MRRGVDLSLSSEVGLVGVVTLSTSASARIYHQRLASMFDILKASQKLTLGSLATSAAAARSRLCVLLLRARASAFTGGALVA